MTLIHNAPEYGDDLGVLVKEVFKEAGVVHCPMVRIPLAIIAELCNQSTGSTSSMIENNLAKYKKGRRRSRCGDHRLQYRSQHMAAQTSDPDSVHSFFSV
jgi:hypothetical protein